MVTISFEVFVDSIHGSDVIEYDDYADALREARKWKNELKDPQDKVVIVKVTKEIVDMI